jgi:hypothetical protein
MFNYITKKASKIYDNIDFKSLKKEAKNLSSFLILELTREHDIPEAHRDQLISLIAMSLNSIRKSNPHFPSLLKEEPLLSHYTFSSLCYCALPHFAFSIEVARYGKKIKLLTEVKFNPEGYSKCFTLLCAKPVHHTIVGAGAIGLIKSLLTPEEEDFKTALSIRSKSLEPSILPPEGEIFIHKGLVEEFAGGCFLLSSDPGLEKGSLILCFYNPDPSCLKIAELRGLQKILSYTTNFLKVRNILEFFGGAPLWEIRQVLKLGDLESLKKLRDLSLIGKNL